MQLTVVYDNKSLREDLISDWGFSCFIQGLRKTILFDTGADGRILLANMKQLGLHPESIDKIVLSHAHKDHTGGLFSLLEKKPGLEIWLPDTYPLDARKFLKKRGASVVNVSGFQKICRGAYTTGVLAGWIREQSLILESPLGLILLTGCAHPRIVRIIDAVQSRLKTKIELVMGGFHLAGFEETELKSIIGHFLERHVHRVGPAHCSGKAAQQLFKEAFGPRYITAGVGLEISIP